MIKPALVLAASLLAAVVASAQYAGPSDPPKAPAITVQEILKKPVDDRKVVLQGHLLRKVGKEKYLFSDGTAEILVEIDDDDFPKQPVDEKTRVEIHGEVDTHLIKAPDIDVDRVVILPAAS